MNFVYFAHNGVEQGTAAEAANHEAGSDLPVILAVTVVAVLGILIVAKLLSVVNKEESPGRSNT